MAGSFQDAIQLVMTGAKQHVNVFNSAQDESGSSRAGGKVRRTLASYAVGMRDNLCARPGGSHTYVAAVFAPEDGEAAPPFTAVVAIEALVSGKSFFGPPGVPADRLEYLRRSFDKIMANEGFLKQVKVRWSIWQQPMTGEQLDKDIKTVLGMPKEKIEATRKLVEKYVK